MTEIAENMSEGLLALAVGAGLQVMAALMEADVTALAGPKGRHDATRTERRRVPRRDTTADQRYVGVRHRFLRWASESALSESLQERVRFSHDVQCGLGGGQPLVHAGEFTCETGDLSLLGGEPADPLPGPLARQHPGVALLAPFTDQRRIQALPPQIGATLAVFARLLVGRQVGKFVRRGERAPPPRPIGPGMVESIRSLLFTEEIVELVMMCQSVSRPAQADLL